MKLLLDTHALLWFISDDPQLSSNARQIVESESHVKFVSVASLWEIVIKLRLGKLVLPKSFSEIFPAQLELNGFELLQISLAHLNRQLSLEMHHRDPFDRLLLSQALSEEMALVSCDPEFKKYSVETIW
jgi:PIN domain nuclease of toxin-antitoxin system